MPIDYGANDVSTSGNFVAASGNFTTLTVNNTPVATGVGVTITNSGDNRVLTSDGTSTGINAESNLTFNGTTLDVNGIVDVDNLRLDGNTLSTTNTNGNIIIQSNGTGALQRDSGGNNRGQYAVDLQNSRTNNSMVAGQNYSVIGGGRDNTASGYGAVVCGGINNGSTSVNSFFSVICGGLNNSSSNLYSVCVGGYNNNADANYSVCAGGRTNNIFSDGVQSSILGGAVNSIRGTNSFICGGSLNQISSGANLCGILVGSANIISNNASHSVVFFGADNRIGGDASFSSAMGASSKTHQSGQQSFSSGFIDPNVNTNAGRSQTSYRVLRARTVGSSSVNMLSGHHDAANKYGISIEENQTILISAMIVARSSSATESAGYELKVLAERRDLLPASILYSSINALYEDNSSWGVSVSIINNTVLSIDVAGSAGSTIDWVGFVRSVEVINETSGGYGY